MYHDHNRDQREEVPTGVVEHGGLRPRIRIVAVLDGPRALRQHGDHLPHGHVGACGGLPPGGASTPQPGHFCLRSGFGGGLGSLGRPRANMGADDKAKPPRGPGRGSTFLSAFQPMSFCASRRASRSSAHPMTYGSSASAFSLITLPSDTAASPSAIGVNCTITCAGSSGPPPAKTGGSVEWRRKS